MVQLMLEGFGGDQRTAGGSNPGGKLAHGVACYHVNARVSRDLEDIGSLHLTKFFLLLWHCLQAIWCHYRHGVDIMYYIPAPGKRAAIIRDWMVMLLCRPFYKKVIFHWHAAGLAKWLETEVQMPARAFTYERLKKADLSIVLSRYNRADAEKLLPKRILVVNNGIPDPCANFEGELLPRRRARHRARLKLQANGQLDAPDLEGTGGDPEVFKILFLAHCTRDKGLFDSISGVILANQKLGILNSRLRIELTVAGGFFNQEEKDEFENLTATPEGRKCIHYLGFVSGADKDAALRNADGFCFPTYFRNENQPVNLIEAMAYGLPILTSRWRSIPELFPADFRSMVDVRSPAQVADTLIAMATSETAETFRDIFLKHFNIQQHLTALAEAFHSVESAGTDESMAPADAAGRPARNANLPG